MRLPPPSAAFGKAAQHGVAVLASCLVLLSPPTPHLAPCASAAPPTEEAQVNLKKGFNAAQLGLTSADALLSASIDEWERKISPPTRRRRSTRRAAWCASRTTSCRRRAPT